MKKLYILLALVIVGMSVKAQSFSASNQYISGNPLFLAEGHVTIVNNSSSTKNVFVTRTVNNLAAGHSSYFCWVQCYTAAVDISPDSVIMSPGSTTDVFRGDLETNSTPGNSTVTYCFYDGNNPGDSVCVEFNYNITVGLSDIPAGSNYISKAYPNPASDVTNFYVNVDKNSNSTQLKFFNMLGAQVKEMNITNAKNSIKVNVSDLKAGIYFYSLWIDGKSTSTGKLMVSRN